MVKLLSLIIIFDGLDDLATPVDQGVNNGPHYAFYIQAKPGFFEYSAFLTEKVIWFPKKIDPTNKTLSNEVPYTVNGLNLNTFRYVSKQKNGKKHMRNT